MRLPGYVFTNSTTRFGGPLLRPPVWHVARAARSWRTRAGGGDETETEDESAEHCSLPGRATTSAGNRKRNLQEPQQAARLYSLLCDYTKFGHGFQEGGSIGF